MTGLQFTDLSFVQGKEALHAPSSAAVGVDVFDYLGQQVLGHQPEWLQLFLLRSSLLEEFDAALCEIALGPFYSVRQDWSKTIDLILQKNLFALPVGTNGQWLRYHHLFRDFLQQRFRNQRPDETSLILQRLAQYHEAHGNWEKAYQLYKQLGDFDALVNLIERAGIPMYQNAKLTLDSWLKDIPPSLLQKRPGLLSLRGAIETAKSNMYDGIELFNNAIKIYRRENSPADLSLALVRRGNAYRFLGDYEEAFHDANEAMELVNTDDSSQLIYADALRIKGLGLFQQGHTVQAAKYLEQALDTYIRLNEVTSIPLLLMETGVMYIETGEFLKAQNSYQKALEFWRQSGNLNGQAEVLNNLGVLYHKHGDYERAGQMLEQGLLCAREGGHKPGEAVILISLGDVYAELEDFEIAEDNYNQAKGVTQQLGARHLINYLALAEFNLALLKNDRTLAEASLEKCSSLIEVKNSKYEYGLYQLFCARLSLLMEDPQRAVNELMKAKQCFVQDGRQAEMILSRVWMAAAQYNAGNQNAALVEMGSLLTDTNPVSHLVTIAVRQARKWLEAMRSDPQAKKSLRELFKKWMLWMPNCRACDVSCADCRGW